MDPLPLGRCTNMNARKQCDRWAHLICSHCNQGICLEHYESHQRDTRTRADQLNNRINDFRQILHTLTHEQIVKISQEKIDQWSKKCQSEIDRKHGNMSAQLSNEMKQLNIDRFRSIQLDRINQVVGEPLMDLLQRPNDIQMKDLERLEEQFERMKKIDAFIQITNRGQLKIDQ